MQTQQITYDTRYAEQLIKSFNSIPLDEEIYLSLHEFFAWDDEFAQLLFYFKEDDCLSTSERPVYSLKPIELFRSLFRAVDENDTEFTGKIIQKLGELIA